MKPDAQHWRLPEILQMSTQVFLTRDDETGLEQGSDLPEVAHPISSWLSQTPSLRLWDQRALKCLVLARDLPPFLPGREGDGKTTGSAMIPRVGKDVIAFADRTVQLSLVSLWELVGHLQKAWEEQLMKRSNSLENCLTFLLYFWIFQGQRPLRSWFPSEVFLFRNAVKPLKSHWIGSSVAGIREQSEYFLKTFRSIVFKDIDFTDLKGA